MSRYIKVAGQSASGGQGTTVDLSTCSIKTSGCVTANIFCGRGAGLCDTRWDLICSYAPTSNTSFGTSLKIDLPTSSYDAFDIWVSGFCTTAPNNPICFYLSNSSCACLGPSFPFCVCYWTCGYITPILSYQISSCACQAFLIYPETNCYCYFNCAYDFNIQLNRSSTCNYVNAEMINYATSRPLTQAEKCKISYNSPCLNLYWNGSCTSSTRFTSIIFCNICNIIALGNCGYITIFGMKCCYGNYFR